MPADDESDVAAKKVCVRSEKSQDEAYAFFLNDIHYELISLYQEEVEYTKSSLLFGVVFEIFMIIYFCKCEIPLDQWPGGPNYTNELYPVWLPFKTVKPDIDKPSELEYEKFYISILTHKKAYFLTIRSIEKNQFTSQKIISELVSTFTPEDIKLDDKKIVNLIKFVTEIRIEFIKKVVKGLFYSNSSPNYCSTGATTSDDSPASSSSLEDVSTLA